MKWHWNKYFYESFDVSLSVLFHQCTIFTVDCNFDLREVVQDVPDLILTSAFYLFLKILNLFVRDFGILLVCHTGRPISHYQ